MCVKEATSKLKKPSLILFFSPVKNFDEYARVLHEQFPESVTKVALNGLVKDNACVFTLMHSESGKIHIFRENIYKPITGNILTVTKADSTQRKVIEYNNEPAAKVFARELGVDESQIEKYLDTNPMGRLVGDEMYVTANCMRSGSGMIYYARIYNNSKVVALKPADYRETIKETKKKIKDEVPHPRFAIMCHCLARTLLFEGNGYLQEYAKDMGNVLGSYIGFSGYGEQKGEEHFNQTMAVAVFE